MRVRAEVASRQRHIDRFIGTKLTDLISPTSPDWITLGNAKIRNVRDATVLKQASGLQVTTGFEVSFGIPVVSVAVVGSGAASAMIEIIALHSPYVVDRVQEAQPTNGAMTKAAASDIIDSLLVAVSAPMTILGLVVVPLVNEVTAGQWKKVAQAPMLASALDYANGAVPEPASLASVKDQLTDAMQDLFDPSATTRNGRVNKNA
jgi:hypothetical protein